MQIRNGVILKQGISIRISDRIKSINQRRQRSTSGSIQQPMSAFAPMIRLQRLEIISLFNVLHTTGSCTISVRKVFYGTVPAGSGNCKMLQSDISTPSRSDLAEHPH